jgi:4-diphosphocytidyl-2C-methyl-D-erythritol kinase
MYGNGIAEMPPPDTVDGGADMPNCGILKGEVFPDEPIYRTLTDIVFSNMRNYRILIVKPRGEMLTKEVFKEYDKIADTIPKSFASIDLLTDAIAKNDFDAIGKNLYNGLFYAAVSLDPSLSGVKETIKECGAFGAEMSGSGNAFFGLFHDEESVKKAYDCFAEKGYNVYK